MGGRHRRIGRHLYRLRIYKRWTGAAWKVVRKYWKLIKRNHFNHKMHGKTKWRWGGYKRIGVHQYRLRTLYRNYQGRWRRVRSYWHLWRNNKYYRSNRYTWGRNRRIGRHLYRQRILSRWTGAKWLVVRRYWHLLRRNHYNHRLHGKHQWRWTNHYKRIGLHKYRRRDLFKNYQGHW